MIRVQNGNFLIIKDVENEKRHKLVQVTNRKPLKVVAADKDRHTQPTPYKVPRENVLANIGPTPIEGKNAYGVKIEPFRFHKKIKDLFVVYSFRELNEQEWDKFRATLLAVGRWFQKCGFKDFFPIEVEIRAARGKYAGTYQWRGKSEENENYDLITFHPKDLMAHQGYVAVHEMSHHIWFRYIPPKIRGKWVRLYHRCLSMEDLNERRIERHRRDFEKALKGGQSIHDYREELEEQDRTEIDAILSHIKGNYSLSHEHVEYVIASGNDMKMWWPRTSIEIVDTNTIVTPYASKNVDELFAEAYTYYLLKPDIVPDNVKELLTSTFKSIGKPKALRWAEVVENDTPLDDEEESDNE